MGHCAPCPRCASPCASWSTSWPPPMPAASPRRLRTSRSPSPRSRRRSASWRRGSASSCSSPTAEGRQFLDRVRALLRDADELERFASDLTAELSGTLHLGCLVTVAPLMMPRLGKGFRERHPAVALEMVEAGQHELVTQLRAGRLSTIL